VEKPEIAIDRIKTAFR
nr:epoxide hydrolase=fragment 1 {EC 3.3.2.3} [Pseudomonas, AD1, Peptide Partial, 16 aa] [Pseudomonas]